MELGEILPRMILLWLLLKALQKAWRLLLALFLVAFISGCAHTSSRFEVSPCACDFTPLNIESFQGAGHA